VKKDLKIGCFLPQRRLGSTTAVAPDAGGGRKSRPLRLPPSAPRDSLSILQFHKIHHAVLLIRDRPH
jgi:hypothetical protein